MDLCIHISLHIEGSKCLVSRGSFLFGLTLTLISSITFILVRIILIYIVNWVAMICHLEKVGPSTKTLLNTAFITAAAAV